VRYRIELIYDVDIDHPPQSLAHDGRAQGLQCLMKGSASDAAEVIRAVMDCPQVTDGTGIEPSHSTGSCAGAVSF